MLKIVANVSKKVPIPGLDFSSQSFMAGIEVEVSDGSTPEQLRNRIREVYHLLEHAVDSEIRSYGGIDDTDSGRTRFSDVGDGGRIPHGKDNIRRTRQENNDIEPAHRQNGNVSFSDVGEDASGNSKGQEYRPVKKAPSLHSSRTATQAQQKAIHAITKAKGLDRRILTDRLKEVYGVNTVEELTVGDASELIDTLKNAS